MTTSTRSNVVRIDFRAGPLSPGPDGTQRRRPAGVQEASAPVAAPDRWLAGLARTVRAEDPASVEWPVRRTCLRAAGITQTDGHAQVQWCVLPPGHAGTHLPAPGAGGARS